MKSLLEKMEKEGVEDSIYSLDRISLWAFLLLGVIIGIDVISLLEECNYFSDKNEKYLMIKNCVLLMVTFFCFVYSFLIRRKLILNEGKIIEQEKINKTLLNVNDELKCFKHDFYNILQSINGYIYLNDLIGLKKYYDNLLAEINEIEYFEKIAKNLKNNPAVFGVLLDKFKKSKEKGIELFVELNHKMQTLGIKNYNVSRMLGVLIDNAIEASAECDNSLVCVNFKEDIEDNCIYIEVKNNYDKNNELDMKKIYDKHYTTKNNSNNQGLGLWKVGKIVMKNEDFNIYTTVEDDVFIQNLKICV